MKIQPIENQLKYKKNLGHHTERFNFKYDINIIIELSKQITPSRISCQPNYIRRNLNPHILFSSSFPAPIINNN